LIVPRDILVDFVDRTRELALFRQMLAGETSERILLILEPPEQGKTCFLQRLVYECEDQRPPVPLVLLDFDRRRSGLTDFLGVAREVRRCLGDGYTPAICACENAIYRPGPLVNLRTDTGDGGVDFGRRGRFTEADISGVVGRDHIDVQIGSISGSAPTRVPIAWQKAEMGRALCRDLVRLADVHSRVVLLIDTFEHTTGDMCAWLERWLFEPLRHDDLFHVVLIVAGRPECRSFFDQPRLWSRFVAPIHFDPLGDEDILAHYRQRGLLVAGSEQSLLLDLARSSPARMAQVGDWLQQTRGGAR
jgi:hypothetical protein